MLYIKAVSLERWHELLSEIFHLFFFLATLLPAVKSLIDYGNPYFLTAVSSLIQMLLPPFGSLQVILPVITAKKKGRLSLSASETTSMQKPQ